MKIIIDWPVGAELPVSVRLIRPRNRPSDKAEHVLKLYADGLPLKQIVEVSGASYRNVVRIICEKVPAEQRRNKGNWR